MSRLITELDNRRLRFDGISVVHPDDVAFFMCHGLQPGQLQVVHSDFQIEQFNEQVSEDEAIQVYDPESPLTIELKWSIPEKYLNLDLSEFIINVFTDRLSKLQYTDDQIIMASERIADELDEIDRRGMVSFVQTIIYVIDELRKNHQVWGVGRGSSCASYILFLLDLHKVDCVKMEIPKEEFFHD